MANEQWPLFRLADLCESIDYGYTSSAKEAQDGPRFLRITDIVSGHINWREVPSCEITPENCKKYRLNDGEIVIARTGATTGVSIYIKDPPDTVFASYLVRMKINPTKANSRYVSYFLKSTDFWEHIRGVLGDKSAQPNASAKTMTQAKLRLPSLPEQKAIASILGALDDKIELNRRMNETLEAMARAIFKSWFVDFDPIPGLGPHKEWQDSPLGRIPKGWRATTLKDAIIIHDSKRIPLSSRERLQRQGHYPYYGAASVMDYVDDYLFDGVYVLIGEDGSVVKEDDTPVIQYVWDKFWVNNHAHVLTGKNEVSVEHLLLFLKQVNIRAFITGAVQLKLNQANLCRIPFLLPPEPIRRTFTETIGPFFARIRINTDESKILAAIRDALLPKLISGELRVPEAERMVERRV